MFLGWITCSSNQIKRSIDIFPHVWENCIRCSGAQQNQHWPFLSTLAVTPVVSSSFLLRPTAFASGEGLCWCRISFRTWFDCWLCDVWCEKIKLYLYLCGAQLISLLRFAAGHDFPGLHQADTQKMWRERWVLNCQFEIRMHKEKHIPDLFSEDLRCMLQPTSTISTCGVWLGGKEPGDPNCTFRILKASGLNWTLLQIDC